MSFTLVSTPVGPCRRLAILLLIAAVFVTLLGQQVPAQEDGSAPAQAAPEAVELSDPASEAPAASEAPPVDSAPLEELQGAAGAKLQARRFPAAAPLATLLIFAGLEEDGADYYPHAVHFAELSIATVVVSPRAASPSSATDLGSRDLAPGSGPGGFALVADDIELIARESAKAGQPVFVLGARAMANAALFAAGRPAAEGGAGIPLQGAIALAPGPRLRGLALDPAAAKALPQGVLLLHGKDDAFSQSAAAGFGAQLSDAGDASKLRIVEADGAERGAKLLADSASFKAVRDFILQP